MRFTITAGMTGSISLRILAHKPGIPVAKFESDTNDA